ncbi:MAG: dipeptide/tripeptide permease [Psychromonas sp.]|nr:dipeptide/tripeptide permease [Psychromonas sp.]
MSNLNPLKQPKQFYLIFSIEFWERFGFYGMQAILTVYFVKILAMPVAKGFLLWGAFVGLVFGTIAIGGWLGDNVIGTKRAITLGAIILTIGYALLGLSAGSSHYHGGGNMIYLAMGFIAMGNGLFKANPSSLLSKIYKEGDPRLDGAFTMYYMSINIGSFIAMLIVPWVAVKFGYGMAFGVCAIGLIFTVINFVSFLSLMKNIGSKPDLAPLNKLNYLSVVVGTFLMSYLASVLLQHVFYASMMLFAAAATIISLYIKETFKCHGLERAKMLVAFVLFIQGIVFFVLYSQMPTSLNFFAINNVQHNIFGITVAPEQFQALNPFWIIIASPLLAIAYHKLGNRFSMPLKFSMGMVLCAFSFLVLKLSASFANAGGIVNANWLVISYALQSVGELFISGLGLAMMAQLVPKRMTGFGMGMWHLSSAIAAVVAGWVATFTVAPKGITDPHQTLVIYAKVFGNLGYITAIIAILSILLAPRLTRIINNEMQVSEKKLSVVL